MSLPLPLDPTPHTPIQQPKTPHLTHNLSRNSRPRTIHVSLPMHYYPFRSNGPQHLCLSSLIALRRSPSEAPKTPDMADSDNDSGGNNDGSHAQSGELSAREQDRFLPIANVSRIMKKALPANAKISKDAKETV